ncbi:MULTISPECIES: phosphoribosylamine--glycine ligase [unclassified Enterococcus]|uniref:phosphoribosylamine--glycine ligase n=1 Tax=unclassified Enterococcus TaxID=2608891 RepID=UPI00155758E1|nr:MULTISPECIES: phosphoribosylamine--glycine ligase [unclassified Enterococcus]MBS7578176.1 phosphoribosylamine--glycine ligase [Enterococcus sp. MMGLQ5-2]MBS7584008.1 phosphoribosylamine--glycine ligase [Enterococcus sp. MMGLQ5-1]NPD11869.1 phosphoribosylamine--glycine ligase [Enterococcus sp. MMGLQ5-1]NPD38007.1 phosphoribosylamine--glycine ligase [Enterococcus sp. MMGLQ5-2]
MKKILVIGSGGREHAIAKKFLESDQVSEVFVAKGNVGMVKDGIQLVDIAEANHSALIDFAKKNQISFTFIGPEVPLMNGIVDDFEANGLRVFGPRKNAAIIEGSKDFAKQLMKKYQIPTAASETFSDIDLAIEYIKANGAPIVIKADGLAAGKGVVVAETEDIAIEAVKDMLSGNKFGSSGAQVVIEEFLDGEEFSLLNFVKDDKYYPMIIAQDHKRAFDGDKGPNTGGMGAYAPVSHIPQAVIDEAIEEIVKPTVMAMINEGTSFTGILYAGLILTAEGPKVIEFNARFGDPETQVVLPRLTSDFAQIIEDILEEKAPEISWEKDGVTIGVVVASEGYPNAYQNGKPLPDLTKLNSTVYYAGVKAVDNQLVSNGGRVLLLAQSGKNVEAAQKEIYNELDQLNFENFFYRHDIGSKAL